MCVTVTLNDPVAFRPPASVTVQSTVVVPSPNVEPDAGVQCAAMTPSSISFPVAVNVTTALLPPVVAWISAGGVNVGALLVTVTVKDPEALSPPESVTVQLTVVVPSGKVEPDGGVQIGVSPAS